jgi:hypothetical protein
LDFSWPVLEVSELALFIVGAVITIPVAAGLYALIQAAAADGRANDRVQAERREAGS